MNRRRFLHLAGATGSLTALSGCARLARAIPGCPNDDRTLIDFQSTKWADDSVTNETSHIIPFDYAGLANVFPEITNEAMGKGGYERCAPVAERVLSFISLTRNRIIRQFDQYDGEPSDSLEFLLESAYVKRGDRYQKIYLVHQGELVSGDALLSGKGAGSK